MDSVLVLLKLIQMALNR